jgi:ABC-type bacteriocin/lantibiotic exporter with double-glycine peptidase domain
MTNIHPLKRFYKLLLPEQKDILYIYLYAIFNGLINLSLPLGIQAIINLITGGQISTSWTVLVTFVMIGIALTGGLQVFQLAITEKLQQRIFTRASFEFAYRIPRIKLESVYGMHVPELVNRFFDTLTVQKGLSKILIDFSTATLQIIFGLILLSFYHPFFILFGILLVVVFYLIFRITGPEGLRTSITESKYKYEVVHWLEEIGGNIETFKLAGNTDLPLRRIDGLVGNYLKARKSHFRILIKQYINMIGFKLLIAAGLLIMGSILVLNQQINLGQFVAAEIVILLIINSAEKLILSLETIYDVLTALDKMGHVTDLPLENFTGEEIPEDTQTGMSMTIRNLSYTFPGRTKPSLNNINMAIKSGERICLSGYSGSGKSTLIKVIAGLYQDFIGTISYNDIPLSNLNVENLRTYIGDSLHEEKLFNGTLYENISLGRPGVDLKKVMQIATHVYLDEYIQNLPNGLNTIINPQGKNLSDSVKSKIILARSLACNTRLLLVTDHLNRLDAVEYEKILDFILDPKNPWTLIAISNQSEIASKCDRVILMEDGKIAEQAPYNLLSRKDLFYNANIA